MTETRYCNVDFYYSKGFPETLREGARHEYIRLRSIAVKLLNPNYEKWNREFDRIYGKRDDYSAEPEYNKFVARKQDAILNAINEQSDWLELYSSEECELFARTKFNKDFSMTITIRIL